jgi:hypothetical protein
VLEICGDTGSSVGDALGVDGMKRVYGRWFDIVVADDEVSLLHPIKKSESLVCQ